jgi:MYXO-CTERM domain-containing protein
MSPAGVLVLTLGAQLATTPDGGEDEATTLARSIADQAKTLSTDDCVAACKALLSMRRAAERLCNLDPGQRCTDARATLDDASKRVRAACPGCAVATMEPPRPAPPLPATPDQGGAGKSAPREEATLASAPPSEHERGGCAGCTTSGAGDAAGDALAAALAMGFLARSRRRRRS